MTSTRRLGRPGTTVNAVVQTNGVGLSDAYLALFNELGVRVGSASTGTPRGMTGTAGSQAAGVVIKTDGSVEQEDTLKIAYDGAAATGLHVARDSLDAALLMPQIVGRQIGARALSAQCRVCPVRGACGGGLYSHRYREGTGFLNPSVYCPDLLALISHIRDQVRADLLASHAGKAAG